MAVDVRPGEVEILSLFMLGPHGIFDMAAALVRASIFESIFKNGNYAEFTVLDFDDALGDLRMDGTETVTISFKVPNGAEVATYVFAVNSITLAESENSRARTYTIECVSPEVQESRTGPIEKKWKSTITGAVTDIFKNFLGSGKSLAASGTRGAQELRISNKKPFTAINELARRANGQSGNTWLFFENRDGYHFKPIEEMQAQAPVRSLVQRPLIGFQSIATESALYDHIIHYTIVSKMSVEKTLRMGALKTNVQTWNQRTREFLSKDVVPAAAGKLGGLAGKFTKPGRSIAIPTNSRLPTTFIPSSTPHGAGAAAGLMQLIIISQVFGDTIYRAGHVVHVTIPKPSSLTGPQQPDLVVTGNFLISKLRHEILALGQEPRYTCVVEALQQF